MQPSYAIPVTILYISVSKICKMNNYSVENFIRLGVLAKKPLFEILHGKSVILGKGIAVCIEPFTTVNFGCYRIIIDVVAEF